MNVFERNYLECNEEYAIQHTIFGSVVPLGVSELYEGCGLSLSMTLYIDVHGGILLEICSDYLRGMPTGGHWSYFRYRPEKDELLIPINLTKALDEIYEIGADYHTACSIVDSKEVEYEDRCTQTQCEKCRESFDSKGLFVTNDADTLCMTCYGEMMCKELGLATHEED